MARAGGCVAGVGPALRVFQLVDPRVETAAAELDGAVVRAGTVIGRVRGPARAILAGERVALNLLGHLSGIATATRALVDRIEGTDATILDTRKTTPLWRMLEKRAVVAGGGANHRMGLYDAVLITHDIQEAVYLGRRILFLGGGAAAPVVIDNPGAGDPEYRAQPQFQRKAQELREMVRAMGAMSL